MKKQTEHGESSMNEILIVQNKSQLKGRSCHFIIREYLFAQISCKVL